MRSKYIYCLIIIAFQYIVPVLLVTMLYCRICSFLNFNNLQQGSYMPSASSIYAPERNFSITALDVEEQIVVNKQMIDKRKKTKTSKAVMVNNFDIQSTYSSEIKDSNVANMNMRRNKRIKRFERSKNLLILVSLTFVVCWYNIIKQKFFLFYLLELTLS